ncbi:MAG: sodium:proton antiporter, partial [Cyanobacteria bacterium P01_A01_bin.17]
ETLVARLPGVGNELQIQLMAEDAPTAAITRVAEDYDLVMLRSQRQFSNGFRMGTSTRTLLEQLSGSVILVNEPYPQHRE